MKFLYGKQDFKTFERGEENCYLMVNGLGGFSSLSMIASCSRNDQAVLMACMHSPNIRYNMIHRLEERLTIGDLQCFLSSQDYQEHGKRENGYFWQSRFAYEDYPCFTYEINGVEVVRTIVLSPGENTVGISYRICNRSKSPVLLTVQPQLQFVPKGERMSRSQRFTYSEGKISSNGLDLYFATNGAAREIPYRFCETLYYSSDAADGKMSLGRCGANHEISFTAAAGETKTLNIVYGTKRELLSVEEIRKQLVRWRNSWRKKAGFRDETAQVLAVSAGQYISARESTQKSTILAGFPFFEDWGRDTMIALPGCCLCTGQYDLAKEILETFMIYCKDGLMPNLFPEGGRDPMYNTVDAALLFILAVYEYEKRTGDAGFVKQAYPVMESIIEHYCEGTKFGIHMDSDGLIMAGQGYDQVTWMDVRVEDILPTPRHGKPVEVNAYWYNALRIMDEFQKRFSETDKGVYGKLADQAAVSFVKAFWNEEAGCLKDVISGTEADDQIRCNQIWAVSLPFSLLSGEQERSVVETVYRKLYTPYGLRTLDPEDKEFRPFYGGAQLDRDLAYHQGTVWTFPLGGYYLAYLKVNGYSEEAKSRVREQLQSIEPALSEGCVGQLPEIYDGGNPVSSKGCFAQAWSVGEILRVYDALR